jgi:hypothetical protein
MWQKIERQWLAVYELLPIAAYRLIGKRYADQGGMVAVQPGETLTRRQRLFCLLFPMLAMLGLMVTLAAVWLYTYTQFFPHIEPRAYYFTGLEDHPFIRNSRFIHILAHGLHTRPPACLLQGKGVRPPADRPRCPAMA